MAIGDVSTGVHGMGAIACALLYRERTGIGQYIDVSLLDSYFGYHDMGGGDVHGEWLREPRQNVRAALPGPQSVAASSGQKDLLSSSSWMDWHWAQFCEQSAILNLRATRVSSICRAGSKTETRW